MRGRYDVTVWREWEAVGSDKRSWSAETALAAYAAWLASVMGLEAGCVQGFADRRQTGTD